MTQIVKWAVFAPPALQALLSREPEAMAQVQAFAEDRGEPDFDIAGPPDREEALRHKKSWGTLEGVPLPCVRIRMRKTKHHLTGDRLIEIACTDAHLVEVTRWNLLASAPKQPALVN
ncbi:MULTISPECIES: hypothetical protein [unclassified Mesorhizobium]|uniref:hypothetical protein n=1 Tax=unclassified Mesorhizobium TaxID=325217 RepID=UPI001678F428|nr:MULTISPECIES: hypothetical protein [unclassified Mesorhizobium]